MTDGAEVGDAAAVVCAGAAAVGAAVPAGVDVGSDPEQAISARVTTSTRTRNKSLIVFTYPSSCHIF